MADQRFARVLRVDDAGETGQLVELAVEGPPLSFRGGQFLYVETGCTGEDGKPICRSWSLFDRDGTRSRVRIAVDRAADGIGSRALAGWRPGDTIGFTGPWGRNCAPEDPERTLVVATDSGITAGSAIAAAAVFGGASSPFLLWGRFPESGFGVRALAEELLGRGPAELEVIDLPPPRGAERNGALRSIVSDLVRSRKPARIHFPGDAAIVEPLAEHVGELGIPEDQIFVERFFDSRKP